MITIVNYEMGNLFSVENAFNFLGYKTRVTDNPEEIINSKIIVLPGVGSYNKAMKIIRLKKIDLSIKESLYRGGKILGICLGMQLLAISSDEDGFTYGLGLIDKKVEKFSLSEVAGMKIPHVGFNSVVSTSNSRLYQKILDRSDFYFVHSYRISTSGKEDEFSYFNYGSNFVASYEKKNVFGTQFHPEKSQTNGLMLLKNFVDQDSRC